MSATGPKKRYMYWFYEIYNQKNSTAIKPSRRASKISIPPNISVVINKGLLFHVDGKTIFSQYYINFIIY